MKQIGKSYLIFAAPAYRLVMFMLMPLGLLGLNFYVFGEPGCTMFLIMMEVVADNWFLGGIQEKNADNLEYLKTSSRGKQVIKSALILDLIRRMLTALAVFGIGYVANRFWFYGGDAEYAQAPVGRGWFYSVWICMFFTVLGTLITRFQSNLRINLLVGYLASVVGIICWIVCYWYIQFYGVPRYVFAVIFAILTAAVSVLAVKIAMARVEGGYYDK